MTIYSLWFPWLYCVTNILQVLVIGLLYEEVVAGWLLRTDVTKFSSFKKLPLKKSLRFHLTEAPEVPGDQKSIQND
ncbi:hypothetical protein IGI04_023013 [Brassica rapa subsp. trilocularis]|uniref:Uncharacterized protein n=1 Tax=Brassica rapa subsp. trilocularis TaxID=1813537 RepID=A0ABQ7M3Z3_BRACM|nr:hypothetical protein IGI04_023013 [Brassica rapa subsp. trilocularis]